MGQKKRIIISIILPIILIFSSTAYYTLPISASEKNRTVKVGFFSFAGYHEIENGSPSGYGYDFLTLLQRYTDLNYEYIGYDKSWADMQQMLLDGEIDLVTSARKTLEREELFDFSEPIGTNYAIINVRADDERFIPGDYSALDGITIGVLSENSRNEDLKVFSEEKGFSYQVKEYTTSDELEQALKEGLVDAVSTSSLRKTSDEKTIAEFTPQDFYVIVKKGNTALLNDINYGIAQMDINEGNWRDDLLYKNYHLQGNSVIAFTQKEREYISAVRNGERVITVAAQPDADPYSFVVDGVLTGIIPDYFAHLMDLAGLSYTTLIASDRDEFHTWIKENHADVIMDFRNGSGMSEMSDFGLLTDPYMELTVSRVTRKGFSGEAKILASVEAWSFDDIEEDPGKVQILQFPSREKALKAVESGKADVCYVYTYTAEKYINTAPNSNLQSTIRKKPVFNEYIYVSPNADHELCSILNKCIKMDASGVLDEYVKKYTTVTYDDMSIIQYLKLHPALLFLGMLFLLALVILIFAVVLRGRTAKLKNEQLVKEMEQQKKLEEALTFTNFFLDTYISAYFVNLDTHDCRVYKRTEQLEEEFPIVGSYVQSLEEYIEKCVHPEDRDELYEVIKPEKMREILCVQPQYVHLFRDISRGSEHMYKLQVIRGADSSHAAFGFIDISDEIKAQQEKILGAIPLSPDILGKANIGLWAFELDKGKAPRMYVDDTMLGLLGLEHQVSPEETYHAWYDHIDEDSYDLVTESVDKMSSGIHAEVQYPWHHPDGSTIIVRCGGVRNYGYVSGIRIEGTHQNVTKVVHYDEAEQRKKRDELVLTVMSALSEAYDTLYYITVDTGEYQLITRDNEFGNKVNVRLAHGGDFYEDSFESISRVIFDEDREKMRMFANKERMEKAFGNQDSFIVEYRLVIDDVPIWYRVKTVKILSADDERYYALGIMRIQEELEQKEQLQKNREIIEILASEYSSVYYVDLTTDAFTPYTMNESTESVFGKIFRNGISFSDAYRMYVDEQILPEDREMMLMAGSIRNIMKELQNKKTFITTYRDMNGHFSEMKFVKVGDDSSKPLAVALGFTDKDQELRAKREAERIRKRNTDIIEILASEYSSVYYIDLTTDEFDTYTMNEETESEFGQIFRSGINFSEAYRLYVDNLVYAEDKDMMLEAGSLYNILNELADKKTFITTYRSDNAGELHYCEMKFVKVGEGENPSAVALGFADKDEEIRVELKRKEIAARDAAVISGLSDDFGCVIYVDFETGTEDHYRYDPLLSANIPGWEEISSFDERIRALAETLIHPDDKDFFSNPSERKQPLLDIVHKEGVFYRNFRVIINDEILYYQLKIIKDENSDNHIIAGLRNIDETAKRELEYQEKLEAANKSKTDFLFNMSHDIRTPMNAIIGFTQLAKKYIDDRERTIDSLNKIESSGNHLLELINEVLDMSRVEAGKLKSEMKTVVVSDAAKRLVTICQENASQRNIALRYHEMNIMHPVVIADELHINQIVMNILGNSVKYTLPGGSIDYSVEETESEIAGYGKFIITVADTGIGMSQEFLKHIYESFSREDKVTTSEIQGTGLGMSIVKRLVDYMDGTINIESEQGKGTKVTVVLHLQLADESANVHEELTEEIQVDLAGKKVLLVEDNTLNREIATDMLMEHGMTVDEAVNGIDAVKHVKERGASYYDFILMDIQMPLMNGFEATMEIRKLPGADRVPIIALSANAFEEDKSKSVEAGMNDHVSKPIVVSKLMTVLSKFV